MFFFVAARGEACGKQRISRGVTLQTQQRPQAGARTRTGSVGIALVAPFAKNKASLAGGIQGSPKVADKSPNELNTFEIGPLTPITRLPQIRLLSDKLGIPETGLWNSGGKSTVATLSPNNMSSGPKKPRSSRNGGPPKRGVDLAVNAIVDWNAPPSGTFTSRLSTDRSPSPLLDIATTATALLCWRDSHPLEWQ